MRRKLLLALLAVVALAAVSTGGWFVHRTGALSPNAWIRHALVEIAEAWLVPDVAVDGFSMEGPTTVALRGVRLTQGDVEVLSCARVAVSLADVPQRGEPLSIARIELDQPVLTFRRDPTASTWKPIGFHPLLEARAVEAPEQLDRALQLSEVLDLRLVRIRGGVLRFDDAVHPPVSLEGIDADLVASPEQRDDGRTGHHLELSLGQPPGFSLTAAGWVDLDARFVALDGASLQVDLSDPSAVARLSPSLQKLVADHDLRGRVTLSAQGDFDLADPLRSRASVSGEIVDLHGVFGALRVPVERARLDASIADGLARIDEAVLRLPGGEARLSQADLAVVDRQVALAGDWTLDALPLHALLAHGSDAQSVASGRGRLFIDSQTAMVGLTVDDLTVGEPEAAPTLRLAEAEVRGAQLTLEMDPLVHIAAVELSGLTVDLRKRGGAWQGLPWPNAQAAAEAEDPDADDAPEARPLWSQLVHLDQLVATGATIRVDRGGGAWEIGGLGVTLTDVGEDLAPALSASLAPGGGVRGDATGRFDVPNLAVDLSRLRVAGPLESAALQGLFPPGSASAVTAYLPRGALSVAGSAHLAFGAGTTTLSLDAALLQGQAALLGLSMPVEQADAKVEIAGGDVRVEDAVLTGAGGTLRVPSLRLSGEALEARWSASRLDLRQITTASGARLATGRLASDGALHGTIRGGELRSLSVVDASIGIDAGPAGRMSWPSINLSLREDGGGRALDARVAGVGGARLDLSGAWPFGASHLAVAALTASADVSGDGRQALPVGLQGSLADLRAGTLKARLSGRLDLDDPVGASTFDGVGELSGGAWRWGDWRVPRVEATMPLAVRGGAMHTQDARLELLSGTVELEEGRWSAVEDRGSVTWAARGLQLGDLSPSGPSARAIEGLLDGEGRLDVALTDDGLGVESGRGEVTVRDGRLVALPALQALSKADDNPDAGNDAFEARFRLDDRAATFSRLSLDLGPVHYEGSGAIRWTGGLDLSLRARRQRKLADLASRLVAWRLHGTTSAPQVQAMPLGVDTRTFEQQRGELRDLELDDEALDDLETAADRRRAPSSNDDDVEFNLDDFDGFK